MWRPFLVRDSLLATHSKGRTLHFFKRRVRPDNLQQGPRNPAIERRSETSPQPGAKIAPSKRRGEDDDVDTGDALYLAQKDMGEVWDDESRERVDRRIKELPREIADARADGQEAKAK